MKMILPALLFGALAVVVVPVVEAEIAKRPLEVAAEGRD